jgi:hypothetical protein
MPARVANDRLVAEEVSMGLERKLQRQLDCPGVISRRDGTEVARAVVGADAAVQGVANPLRVVPNVEEFRAELETGPVLFVEQEVFEKRDIPIVAARAANTVMRLVTPGPWGWHGKDGCVKPLVDSMGVNHCAAHVWTVGGIRNDTRDVLTA